jgi:hypothetical protein
MDLRSRMPLIVAGAYALMVLCLFIPAIIARDGFGFSGIPFSTLHTL